MPFDLHLLSSSHILIQSQQWTLRPQDPITGKVAQQIPQGLWFPPWPQGGAGASWPDSRRARAHACSCPQPRSCDPEAICGGPGSRPQLARPEIARAQSRCRLSAYPASFSAQSRSGFPKGDAEAR